jgi:hypothetical protein
LSEKGAKYRVFEGPMGDFGWSVYSASLRGPGRDSLSKTIVTITLSGYLSRGLRPLAHPLQKRRAKFV